MMQGNAPIMPGTLRHGKGARSQGCAPAEEEVATSRLRGGGGARLWPRGEGGPQRPPRGGASTAEYFNS